MSRRNSPPPRRQAEATLAKPDARPHAEPPPAADSDAQLARLLQGQDGPRLLRGIMQEITTGDLPPPTMLREYESIMPGFGARLMAQTEKETDHRHALEVRQMTLTEEMNKGQLRLAWWGMWIAFVLSLVGLLVAYSAFKQGHPIWASLTAGTEFVTLGGVYVFGRRVRRGLPPKSASPPTD